MNGKWEIRVSDGVDKTDIFLQGSIQELCYGAILILTEVMKGIAAAAAKEQNGHIAQQAK
jgi:hypothetical protein